MGVLDLEALQVTALQPMALLASLPFSCLLSFNLPVSQLALLLAQHLKQEQLSPESLKSSYPSTAACKQKKRAVKPANNI